MHLISPRSIILYCCNLFSLPHAHEHPWFFLPSFTHGAIDSNQMTYQTASIWIHDQAHIAGTVRQPATLITAPNWKKLSLAKIN